MKDVHLLTRKTVNKIMEADYGFAIPITVTAVDLP